MNTYKVLNNHIFKLGVFKLLPIRFEDRLVIMKWRNEQIYHLRQDRPLTVEDQENYFKTVVLNLFRQEQPNQILFSFLENDILIGYGGLVHINWIDKNAEISFIMDTKLEELHFNKYWKNFLVLLEILAFKTLNFHKIFTYAYNIRPKLFEILIQCNYTDVVILHEHVLIDNVYEDVLIHSKLNKVD